MKLQKDFQALKGLVHPKIKINLCFTFICSHLADTFIQSNLQMRTMEAIKINKIAMCYNKSQLA